MTSTITGDWRQLLTDKVVILTGGAGYLAQHIAKTCYAHGARVVLGDLNPIKTNKVKDEIIETDGNKEERILVVKLDVTDATSIQQAVQLTLDKWNRIDVLLNTAAITTFGNVEQVGTYDWSHCFNVNVRGYALMAKYIAPIMKKQNSGSIINMASVIGSVAISNTVLYSAAKSAIIQMTRDLALSLGSFNIRVNSISPGRIQSPMADEQANMLGLAEIFDNVYKEDSCLKRVGEAKDISNTIVFLASDLCTFMSGTDLIIDGGMMIV